MDSNILLARELVRRPELMQAFDRRGTTGEMDNRLSKADIERFVNSSNPLKLATDKDIVLDVLRHFNTLKGGFWNRSIDLSTFEKLATQPWTGDPKRDHLIQLFGLSHAVAWRPMQDARRAPSSTGLGLDHELEF
ncbi:hypothetical protein AO262_19840 [Pseudomonas fluorescens ABAC62]|nr:hypothetical protein AO262_19840 [Pseudomonas fluorescens ABAC62]